MEPSLSSTSLTKSSPLPSRALAKRASAVTKFFITAPFITVGCRPARCRIQPIMPVVVDLPLVPATPMEIMIGKITPFIGIGAVQALVILAAAKVIFDVPFVGSSGLLFACLLLFVLALVLLGYLISTVARTQMQAMQLSIFIFLPSILLSGFMFPFRGMPEWAQALGEILPVTHLLRMVRAVMLKGAGSADIAPDFAALLVTVAVLGALALLRFRRTLD